jgi:hypothetical protein
MAALQCRRCSDEGWFCRASPLSTQPLSDLPDQMRLGGIG